MLGASETSHLSHVISIYSTITTTNGRSQWPRGVRRRSAAARLLRLWVRIPPGAWMFVCCECCVLSGRCLCDELLTRPEKSYRLWCVVMCDLETSRMRRPWPALVRSATGKKKPHYNARYQWNQPPLSRNYLHPSLVQPNYWTLLLNDLQLQCTHFNVA